MNLPVCAVFDVGKTNKKLFLFDENYQIVFEKNDTLPETTDEDGFPCEDVALLSDWVIGAWQMVNVLPGFDIKAVNFSGYGASLVNLGADLKPATPLYNYLKPYPEDLQKQFYDAWRGEETFATVTASPVLGHLNSAMLLYRLSHQKPDLFAQIKYSLHLPQYLSFLISGQCHSDITSIGCHTNLWDFQKNQYHQWVTAEGIDKILAPVHQSPVLAESSWEGVTGLGLHDSSSALIPYLASFDEPFLLLSTGTWSITLNPFSQDPLTIGELRQDCLNYLTYEGQPVKASRLFLGKEHEEGVHALTEQFGVAADAFKKVRFEAQYLDESAPESFEKAYHQLVKSLADRQIQAIQLAKGNTVVKKVFVDGGFSKNDIYMKLLAKAFADCEVYAATVAQASALGAALAIREAWNPRPLPARLVELTQF
ncbi:MAG: FGGY-family carbohydrate kinase [Spirosomaceae bacterium]|jgi:sugar (pentulose or hexulose) kinase|nr:FGGY-family carbohydrate kinase [Spirosomataceae bacterium]